MAKITIASLKKEIEELKDSSRKTEIFLDA
jgi:hypothetical protein